MTRVIRTGNLDTVRDTLLAQVVKNPPAVLETQACSFPGAKSVSDGGNLAVQSRGTTSPLKTVAKLSHLWVSGASWGQATAWG